MVKTISATLLLELESSSECFEPLPDVLLLAWELDAVELSCEPEPVEFVSDDGVVPFDEVERLSDVTDLLSEVVDPLLDFE